MANNYGAFSEKAYPKDNNAGAYQESKKVVFSKTPKSRTKASDTSKMNSVYKPKASPGPAMNTLNLYGAPKLQTLNKYGSPSPRTKPESLNLYGAPKLNAKPKPRSNFNYTAPKADKAKPKAKAKSKNVAGFKPGSVGAKFINAFKNTGK